MNERMKSAIAGVLVAALVFSGGFFVGGLSGPVGQAQQMGTSHITSDVVMSGAVEVSGSFDMSGGNIVLENDEEIDNSSDGTVAITDGSNTLFSVVDGGTTGNANVTGALDVQGGDITMENDETLSNSTDGVVQAGGNLAFSEGTAITCTNDVTFTVAGSFQPLVSASALTGTLIADGSVAGQIVVLTNENGSDNIVIAESGSNLEAGGDIQLDGGNDDAVMLLWTGDEWIKVAAFGDN